MNLIQASPSFTCNDGTCFIEFQLEADLKHKVELVREKTSVFSDKGAYVLNGNPANIPQFFGSHVRYHSKPNEKFLASCSFTKDHKELIEGIFFTEKHGVIEYESVDSDSKLRRRLSRRTVAVSMEEDVVFENPEKIMQKKSSGELIEDEVKLNSLQPDSEGYYRFYPNCFTNDRIPHKFTINLVVDFGLYDKFAPSGNVNDLLRRIEAAMAIGRLLYLRQLNVQVEVGQVIFGNANDPFPLSQAASRGTCIGSIAAFNEFVTWNLREGSSKYPSGYTLLISDCFSGISGTSYISSICSSLNAGVAQFNWLVMFHELGHGFGAQHSFENGQYFTGGIMDYGNGLYEGVYQFHPLKRLEVCNALESAKLRNCPYFEPTAAIEVCGDGILTENEECECLAHTNSCTGCSNCRTVDRNAECSSDTFVLRTSDSPAIVIVGQGQLQSVDCCRNRRFAPPKTMCSDGISMCGAKGFCLDVCGDILGWTSSTCGFDTSGCQLGCVYQGICRRTMTYTAKGVTRLLGSAPDGTPCFIRGSQQGQCLNTHGAVSCVPLSGTTLAPTPATPSPVTRSPETSAPLPFSPSQSPATSAPLKNNNNRKTKAPKGRRTQAPFFFDDFTATLTRRPTPEPTSVSVSDETISPSETSETKPPSASLVNCATIRNQQTCRRTPSCQWSGRACRRA